MKNLFLLEDVELDETKEEEKEVVTEAVIEDKTGLIALTLEAEMSWNNLHTEIVKEEFQAIMKEDEEQATKSRSEFFKKAIAFFQELWKKFVQVIRNLVSRLQVQFTNGEKFLASRKEKLARYQGDKTVSIYNWKVKGMLGIAKEFPTNRLGGSLVGAINQAAKSGKAVSADEIAKGLGFESFSAIDKGVVAKARGNEKVEVKVSPQVLSSAANDVKSAKQILGIVNQLGKQSQGIIQEGRKAATAGLNAKDPQDQQKQSAAVQTAKAAQSVLNKVLNVFVKLEVERYGDSMRIVSAATSGGSAGMKADKKASKNAAKGKRGNELAVSEDFELDEEQPILTLEDFEEDEETKEEEIALEDLEDLNLEDLEEIE